MGLVLIIFLVCFLAVPVFGPWPIIVGLVGYAVPAIFLGWLSGRYALVTREEYEEMTQGPCDDDR